jgi:hypothetical protein
MTGVIVALSCRGAVTIDLYAFLLTARPCAARRRRVPGDAGGNGVTPPPVIPEAEPQARLSGTS